MMITSGPIQSILLATDLGEGAAATIASAAELSATCGATLHVFHANEEPSIMAGDGREILAIQRQVHQKRKTLLDVVSASTLPATRLGNVKVKIGAAAQSILNEAREVEADVIVLGAHRHRGMADRFLGSTAELIIRHATAPCLVLNAPFNLPIRRILVPSDFSAPSRRAIRTALGWAGMLSQRDITEVLLAHVLDPSLEVGRLPWAEKELASDLQIAVEESSGGAIAGVPMSFEILRGSDPAEELIGYARAAEADLIVLGTHGDGVLVRALMGSVSSAMVRRSPIAVLLVPRAAATGTAPAAPDAEIMATPLAF